jgi:hypothetical protein
MRLVALKNDYSSIFDFPTEIMSKDKDGNDRPFLIVVSLKYKDKRQNFGLPFRSNIQVNKNTIGTYFPLPNRPTTKPGHAHGLHYIKIFPINARYYQKYTMKESTYNTMLMEYIENNISKIVEEAQNYLVTYEQGERPNFCTDIDKMIEAINNYEELKRQETALIKEITQMPGQAASSNK